jgi:hypothetical protein
MDSSVHPHQALAVYAEPLAVGRRVVVLADPETGLAERLEELGAETVVLVAPDDDLDALRTARFDLALVADLARFEDPADVVARVRRMVGDSGAAVIAATNREPSDPPDSASLDYYTLFDVVAREFADVRMVARLGFHGVALAEVGEEDESPAVSVDTQLADPDRTPEAFVAVASQRGTSLDPYAIVELPEPEPVFQEEAEDEGLQSDLDEARLQVHALVDRVQLLEASAGRAAELEHDLAARGRQLAELSSEVEEMRSAAEAGRIAAAQVGELALRADRAERALALAEPELARVADAHAGELHRFEEALRERAQAVRMLEVEVARRERLVRELVAAVEEQGLRPPAIDEEPPAPPAEETNAAHDANSLAAALEDNARLQRKLDALALELARREGDAQATAWTIDELEAKLGQAQAQGRPAGAGPLPSAELLDELDALRRALSQEHEARVRAESGEELVRARAEIQRQAVLLDQLGQKSSSTEELR